MEVIKKLLIIIILFGTAAVILMYGTQIKTFTTENPLIINTDSIKNTTTEKVAEKAKGIVESECSSDMWKDWRTLSQTDQNSKLGLTSSTEQGILLNRVLTIDLYIHKDLTDDEQIKSVAWHECGHAKTYNMESDKVIDLHNEIEQNFSNCEDEVDECLADAMAQVKTGNNKYNTYLSNPSQAQLDTAEKVWKASGQVNHINNRSNEISWIELTSTK